MAGTGQPPLQDQELLQPRDMLEDLRYIATVLQEVHPALESRSAQEEFASRASALEEQVSRPLPAWEFFALAGRLIGSLNDAHTALWPPDTGLLPVGLTWAEDGIVVTRVLDPTLPVRPGDELVSLGGRTPEQLLADLSARIPHGNVYWVKALSGRYLENALVLQGLGLVQGQGGRVGQETVNMVVRRPGSAASRQAPSDAVASANTAGIAATTGTTDGITADASTSTNTSTSTSTTSTNSNTSTSAGLVGTASSSGAAGNAGTIGAASTSVAGTAGIASPACIANTSAAGKGGSADTSAGTRISVRVPIWRGLTIVQMVENTDTATGRTFSPAAEAGLRPGDRIVKAGGAPVSSTGELGRAIQEYGRQGRALPVEVLRRGQQLTFAVRPIARRDPGAAAGSGPSKGEAAYVIGVAFGGVPAGEPRPWFGWTVDRSAGYGLFWLDDCNDTKDYRRAVDEFFAAVRKDGIQRIAIDLRRNGGGNTMVAKAFLKYLPYRDKDLRAPTARTRPSRQLSEQRGFWLRTAMSVSQTFFNGRWFPYPIQPRARESELFRGEVYVLTSWNSFSAAVDFAAILSDNHLAQVVGAPTGGAPSGYGDILNFRTPNTGWAFNVSTTRFVRPDPARDPADALYPDVPIPTTMRDIREGRDPVLEWLRNER